MQFTGISENLCGVCQALGKTENAVILITLELLKFLMFIANYSIVLIISILVNGCSREVLSLFLIGYKPMCSVCVVVYFFVK